MAQPEYEPLVEFDDDLSFKQNLVADKFYQFRYRYVYDDNEKSTWSPISQVAYADILENASGKRLSYPGVQNVVNVDVKTGGSSVVSIEIAVREGNNGIWKRAHIIDKKDTEAADSLVIYSDATFEKFYRYRFKNTEALLELDQEELSRPFDYVPQRSRWQEFISENVLVDANIYEGFDNVDIDVGLKLSTIDNDINAVSEIVDGEYWTDTFDPDSNPGTQYTYTILVEEIDITNLDEGDSLYVFANLKTSDGRFNGAVDQLFTWNPGLSRLDFLNKVFDFFKKNRRVYFAQGKANIRPAESVNILAQIVLCGDAEWVFEDEQRTYIEKEGLTKIVGGAPKINLFDFLRDEYQSVGDWPSGSPTTLDMNKIVVYTCYAQGRLTNASSNAIIYKASDKRRTWLPGQTYKFGLVYQDKYGRHGAVNTNKDFEIYVPHYSSGNIDNTTVIDYTINHRAPAWAHRWKLLCAYTEEYYQYVAIKVSDIDSVFWGDSGNFIGLPVNKSIDGLKYGLAGELLSINNTAYYRYNEGDRISFIGYKDVGDDEFKYYNNVADYVIRGQEYRDTDTPYQTERYGTEYLKDDNGNKILDEAFAYILVDSLPEGYESHEYLLVKVYRPVKVLDDKNQLYYEIGEGGYIDSGNGFHQRTYNSKSDSLYIGGNDQGMTVPLQRRIPTGNSWLRAEININDGLSYPIYDSKLSSFVDSSFLDKGRPGIVDPTIRGKWYKTMLRYSGRYEENSAINNLSRVVYDDVKMLPVKYGAISIIQQVGDVLKVKQKKKNTSIYIGREELRTADGGGNVVASGNILGTDRVPVPDYGTEYPYSVVKHNRYEYFVDLEHGVVIRDSANGMIPISDYKMKTWFKELCIYFRGLTNKDIKAGYDGINNEYIVTFVDYDNMKAWTHVFNELTDRWTSFYTHEIETSGYSIEKVFPLMYMWIGNKMYSYICKSPFIGQILDNDEDGLWEHNRAGYNRIYGDIKNSMVSVTSNAGIASSIKNFEAMSYHCTKRLGLPNNDSIRIPATARYPNGMISRLKAGKFSEEEGIFYSELLNNMISRSSTPTVDDLINGDNMRGYSMTSDFEYDAKNDSDVGKMLLFLIDIYFNIS